MMGFREALVEEMEKVKLQEKSWKTIAKRVSANFFVLLLLVGSAYAVVIVVERSTQVKIIPNCNFFIKIKKLQCSFLT